MERLTNRNYNSKLETVVQYVELEKESPETIIQIVEKEVPVEKVVIEYRDTPMDLSEYKQEIKKQTEFNNEVINKINQHADIMNNIMNWCNAAKNELEMQRQALVGLKVQRDVDRKRRLTLINKIKNQHVTMKKNEFKLKLIIYTSFLLSIVSLIIKL